MVQHKLLNLFLALKKTGLLAELMRKGLIMTECFTWIERKWRS